MAMREKIGEKSGERFKQFQLEILIVFAAIILIVTAFLDYIILDRSGRAMRQTVSSLIAANSRQLELNINSYLDRMQTVPTLLFSDESFYLYDATDDSIDEYDKVKSEEVIKDRIVDIGLMENYADFGIIYADDHKVGWISHGTQDLFPEGGMYDAFAKYIVNPKKNDGWCFGINGNTDRMYYIKRLNPNAILVSSAYTKELASVFIYPEQLDEMNIRLVDSDNTIMFSETSQEIGEKLPEAIANELEANKVNAKFADMSSSIISEDYIINSNVCGNDWRVICSVPTKIILEENLKLRSFTLRVSMGMAILFVFIGLFLITRLSRPVDGMVTTLQEKAEIDKLSGVMNRGTFQETVEMRLQLPMDNRIIVYVMLDMDNFKQVNDKLGHSHGDQVIIRVGNLLRSIYNSETIIGRIGGDEFALYSECIDMDKAEVVDVAKEQMDYVLEQFHDEFVIERDKCGVSISAGVFVTDKPDITFKELYEKADGALYKSKQAGKSQYTLIEG